MCYLNTKYFFFTILTYCCHFSCAPGVSGWFSFSHFSKKFSVIIIHRNAGGPGGSSGQDLTNYYQSDLRDWWENAEAVIITVITFYNIVSQGLLHISYHGFAAWPPVSPWPTEFWLTQQNSWVFLSLLISSWIFLLVICYVDPVTIVAWVKLVIIETIC